MNNITHLQKDYEPQYFNGTADFLEADRDGVSLHLIGNSKVDLCAWEDLDNFIGALNTMRHERKSFKKKLMMDFMRVKR